MYKLVKLYDITTYDNVIRSAKAEFICEFDDIDEDELLSIRDSLDRDDSDIFVVWCVEDDIVTCDYVLFDTFVDVAEWDFRVMSSVAADWLDLDFRM